MRIIRMTTTDPKGIFDNTFDSNILIKPNSQLALKSCTFETQSKVIEIDSSNNEITFQVETGVPNTFQISNGSYDSFSYPSLFDDMMTQANKQLVKTALTNLGMEVFYGVEKNDADSGRFVQQYFQGEYLTGNARQTAVGGYATGELGLQLTKGTTGWARTGGTSGNAEGRFRSDSTATTGVAFGDSFMYGDKYIARGGGQTTFQIRKVDMTIGNEQGVFGFTTTNPNTFTAANPPTLSDIAYGVAITNTTSSTGGAGDFYDSIVAGVRTPSAAQLYYHGLGNNNNDYIRMGISGGQVYCDIHSVIGGVNTTTTILSETYTFPDKLYPIWVALTSGARAGTNTDFVFTKLRWTTSPREPQIQPNPSFVADEVGANRPPQPSRAFQNCFMEFEGDTLASFLGYRFTRSPSVPGSFTRIPPQATAPFTQFHYEVAGDELFRPTALSDAFIVELLNLQVDSYDGLKESRKPYLAVVPRSDKDGEVIYDTTFPVFVDLSNSTPLNLRNIKARLLNSDGSEVLIEGLASLVVLLKEKGEVS